MLNKLPQQSPDLTSRNIDRIAALFPNCVTERLDENGNLTKGINFELLKQELSSDVIEYGEEHYEFTWVGKKESIVEGNSPIRKTLRPCIDESVDFENTGNLYIEGDNMDVLKLLQESYLNQVKMIYIDPPYNTGNDSFVYNDKRYMGKDEYEEEIEYRDDEDYIQFKQNNEANPRFHSDWCSMLYPRLKLAQNLLTDVGVIFISIDDNEIENLKKMCNEVFGEDNLVACVIWKRKRGRDNSAKWFSKSHEYLLIYAKSKNLFNTNYLELDESTKDAYKNPDNDQRGIYRMLACWARGTQGGVKYDFTTKNGQYFSERLWLFSKDNLAKMDSEDRLIIRGDNIYRKLFIDENKGKIPETLWDNVSNAANASDEIKKLFDDIVFDTPKPIPYVMEMLKITTNIKDNDLILDFFSGSSTTAHAVMQLNAEDGGNRKFIMVQLPEVCAADSEAAKAGYKNICEIGKERIRRAGKKINEKIAEDNAQLKIGEEQKPLVDVGFRVLKVDSTNMKDVYYAATELEQNMLIDLESNIKDDRTDLDLLYGVLLDWGLPLTLSHKIEQIEGITVHTVDVDSLVACFAEKISESVIREIASRQPRRVVFRDSSFANSPDKLNVEEIFKCVAPDTVVRVI